MIVEKLREIGDLSVGQRSIQAVYVVKATCRLVWDKTSRISAWFHDRGWHHDKGWFHS